MRTQVLESTAGQTEPQRRSAPEDFAHPPEKFSAPHTHRVLVTACDTDEVRRQVARLGIAAVLRKPFDIADIESVAARVLDEPRH